jgi:Ser-tRNA(Ala) deacylase AlaX
LAELVAYLQLAGEWPKTAVDDDVQEQVSWQSDAGVMRQATMPRIILLRT